LQTGLAPGYIDLRKRTFQQFCTDFKVDSVTNLELKVGALNMPLRHIIMVLLESGWVATEYLKDTIVLRDYVKTSSLIIRKSNHYNRW
jgi:hypothetical protein